MDTIDDLKKENQFLKKKNKTLKIEVIILSIYAVISIVIMLYNI